MSFKSLLAIPFAKRIKGHINKWANKPIETQEIVFEDLIEKAKHTQFGKDHNFQNIKNH